MTDRNRNQPFESSPGALAQLVSAASSDDDEWTDDDLRDQLRHQLTCSLALATKGVCVELSDKATALAAAQSPAIASLLDLFSVPNPSLDLLGVVKELTKRARERNTGLPEAMWLALYYACIATALVRQQQRITALDDAGLIKAFRWAVAEAWVVDELKVVFAAALRQLGSSGPAAPASR